MKVTFVALILFTLSSASYASLATASAQQELRTASEIRQKLADIPGIQVSNRAILEVAARIDSRALNQVADSSDAPATSVEFKCAQIRAAVIIITGTQFGFAACHNQFGTYLIKYTTKDLSGLPSTIGFGAGITITGAALYAQEQNIAGTYSCTNKAAARAIGGGLMKCSTDADPDAPKPGSRNLSFYGVSLGVQAEYGVFEIEIW